MDLFPYTPRQFQQAIMTTIQQTLTEGSHLVLESGTGSGKTICTLSTTLSYALDQKMKIIYTTRTNSQQQQVIHELREIRKRITDTKTRDALFGVGVQGRANMCPQAQKDPELISGTSDELSRYCANEKKKARNSSKGCKYYRTFVEDKQKVQQAIDWITRTVPTAEEFISFCEKKHICPYELNKLLVRDAILVVVPYIYVFNVTIRNMLFDWLSVSEDEIIIIVDEAHNLPDYIRDLYSNQLSAWMARNCASEADQYGNPSLVDGNISLAGFCKTLGDIIHELRDTYVYNLLEQGIRRGGEQKTDAFLPTHEFLTELLTRTKINTRQLNDIIDDFIAYGEKIQEYKQKQNKLPRSYIHKLGIFLDFWKNIAHDQFANLIVDAADGKNPRIEAFCLDPSIGTSIIRKFHASIHMSGTLEPLEEYRDSLGLPEATTLVSFPSPFPREHRKICYVNDVTTKYADLVRDPQMIDRIWSYISSVCNTFPRNTIVFFPSFNTLSMFQKKKDFSVIDRSLFFEAQKMSQSALMELVADFKSFSEIDGESATLFSVMGGRISEGMDFPAEELEIAVIVGIPYPKPTARQRGLQRYYDTKFGKGWEYTVEAPTARKMLQAIGRLIRNEDDKGVAIILDRRARRFKRYVRELTESKSLLSDIDEIL